MDLEIRYENGSMMVHLEEFLNIRSITKVRKLLKLIRSSFNPECEQQIKEFVQEQTEQFEQVQKEHSIYIEGYTQKVKYAEQQIMQTKHCISQIQTGVKNSQLLRQRYLQEEGVLHLWLLLFRSCQVHTGSNLLPEGIFRLFRPVLLQMYMPFLHR